LKDLLFQKQLVKQAKQENLLINQRDLIIKKSLVNNYSAEYKDILNKTKSLADKEDFMNKKDEQLMLYIGKPDKSLFFSRGKKTFIYQVDPGNDCENRVLVKNVRSLRFDINALGRIELVYMIAQ